MPFNAVGFSLNPINNIALVPTMTTGIPGLTTAQMTANSSYTAQALNASASTLVDAAKVRTTGITIVVPTDQPAVAIDNTPLVGPFPNWQNLPALGAGSTLVNSTGLSSGFLIAPGNSVFLSPYNDALYAYPVNASASRVYFVDT